MAEIKNIIFTAPTSLLGDQKGHLARSDRTPAIPEFFLRRSLGACGLVDETWNTNLFKNQTCIAYVYWKAFGIEHPVIIVSVSKESVYFCIIIHAV